MGCRRAVILRSSGLPNRLWLGLAAIETGLKQVRLLQNCGSDLGAQTQDTLEAGDWRATAGGNTAQPYRNFKVFNRFAPI